MVTERQGFELGRRLVLLGSKATYELELHHGGDTVVCPVASSDPAGEAQLAKVALTAEGAHKVNRELETLGALGERQCLGLPWVIDAGSRDGLPWFVMPRLGPETLKSRLGDGRAALVDSLRVVRDVAAALRFVHERGWVHGDVSPPNIVLSSKRAHLIDFGEASRPCELSVSPTERRGATWGYVAPERLRCMAWDLRSDVYALGCVFFEMVAGRPVFEGNDADALARQHMQRPIPDVISLCPEFPSELLPLLDAMLQKDPFHRLSDLQVLVQALGRVLGDPTPCATVPVICSSRLWGRSVVWDELTAWLEETLRSGSGAALLVGAEGIGRTRLLHEVALWIHRRGHPVRSGWETTNDELTSAGGPPPVLLFDDVINQQSWEQICAERLARGDVVILGTRPGDPSREQRVRQTDARRRIFWLGALGREASRRVVRDMTAGLVSEELVERLARWSLGRPRELQRRLEELSASGALVRGPSGSWTFASDSTRTEAVTAPPSSELHAELLLLRRAAHYARRREPVEALRKLEAAYELARVSEDVHGRKLAVRLGASLLAWHSRAADHRSVFRVGAELIEQMVPADALLEAQVRRRIALSHRITGEHRASLEELNAALQRLAHGTSRAFDRERVRNRLDASWTLYADHEADGAYRTVQAAVPFLRRAAAPELRAAVHIQLANAWARKRRFSYTERAVAHNRRALALLERKKSSPKLLASARFELGFMLLLGKPEHCTEAIRVLSQAALEQPLESGGMLSLRIATYLTIAYRRARMQDEAARQGSMTLEYALDCGQRGYVGALQACAGWLALHRGELEEARDFCLQALELWSRNRSTDVERKSEFPFQWLALVPLLSILDAEGRADESRPLVLELTHPTQAALAPPVAELLREGREAPAAWSAEAWQAWSRRFSVEAARARYL